MDQLLKLFIQMNSTVFMILFLVLFMKTGICFTTYLKSIVSIENYDFSNANIKTSTFRKAEYI